MSDCFLSEEDFEKYSLLPTFEEYLYQFGGQNGVSQSNMAQATAEKAEDHRDEGRNSSQNDVPSMIENLHNSRLLTKCKGNTKEQKSTFCLPDMPYPKVSLLRKQDHTLYMDYVLQRTNPESQEVISHIQRIKNMLITEQAEFQNFLKNFAHTNYKTYNDVPLELISRIKSELVSLRSRIKGMYQGDYTLCQVLVLPQTLVVMRGVVMNYVKTLQCKGSVQHLKFPSMGDTIYLPTEKNIFRDIRREKSGPCLKESSLKLLVEQNAHVFLPTSTILTLVNSHGPDFTQEWRIPFSIVRHESGNKVIFHQPIFGSRLSTREAYSHYHQAALVHSFASDTKLALVDLLKGASSHPTVSRSSTAQFEGNEIYPSQEEVGSSTAIKQATNSSAIKPKDAEAEKWPYFSRSYVNTTTKEKTNFTPDDTFFTLDLWSLGQFNIVISTDADNGIFCSHSSDRGKPTFIIPFTKVELQVDHGFEQFSVNDLCRMWWKMFLFQPSTVLCCRIHPKTQVVERATFFHMNDLVDFGSPFNPIQSNKLLHEILLFTNKLRPGDYVMKHDSGQINAVIYEQVRDTENTKGGKYRIDNDLDEILSQNWPVNLTRVEWIPIDTCIPKRNYIDAKRIPCTFPIQGYQHRRKQQATSKGRKKKKCHQRKVSQEAVRAAPVAYTDTFF